MYISSRDSTSFSAPQLTSIPVSLDFEWSLAVLEPGWVKQWCPYHGSGDFGFSLVDCPSPILQAAALLGMASCQLESLGDLERLCLGLSLTT